MFVRVQVLMTAVFWTAVAAGSAAEPAADVRVLELDSSRQAAKTAVHVLLPERFDPHGEPYRVLYVLPVEAGLGRQWGDALAEIRRTDVHNRRRLICVYPTFADLPWYCDHPTDPKLAQESYLLRDVLPLIEREFPTRREAGGRLVVGFSKSGWGALSLLFRHPETFGKAAAWDAPLMMERPNNFGMGPIFGTQENFERYRLTALFRQQAAKFQEEPRFLHCGYDNFRDHHTRAEALLEQLHIRREFRDGPQRKHAWGSGWVEEAVEWLAK